MTHLKYLGLAAVLSGFSSFALAQAAAPMQTPPPLPQPPANAAIIPGGPHTGGTKPKNVPAAAFGLGWNFRVCQASVWYTPDNLTSYLYVFNTDGSSFFTLSGVSLIGVPILGTKENLLLAACQHGTAGYYIYITNTATLTYSAVSVAYP